MNRRGRTPFIRTCWGTSDSCNRSLADFFSFPIYYLESWKVGSLRNASGFNFDQLGVYYITRSVIFNRMFETKIFLLFFFCVSNLTRSESRRVDNTVASRGDTKINDRGGGERGERENG